MVVLLSSGREPNHRPWPQGRGALSSPLVRALGSMASQLDKAVAALHVPDVLRKGLG
jgi:hypothetical protein